MTTCTTVSDSNLDEIMALYETAEAQANMENEIGILPNSPVLATIYAAATVVSAVALTAGAVIVGRQMLGSDNASESPSGDIQVASVPPVETPNVPTEAPSVPDVSEPSTVSHIIIESETPDNSK